MTANIVVIDGYTLNPGDLSWDALARHGDLQVYDSTEPGQVIERLQNAHCVLTNKIAFDQANIDALPQLRYIGVTATGYNVVDTDAAARRGIPVTNVPTYGTDSVAQHAAALLLELARRVSVHDHAVHQGQWSQSGQWCLPLTPITELAGLTMGFVGLGRIGLALAKIAQAMGMTILACDPYQLPDDKRDGVQIRYVPLDTLLAESDVVTLHCPLTADNERLIDAAKLQCMKSTAFLINTSRGQLIDNQALADALHNNTIAAAALDVLDAEPPDPSNPLLTAPNCIITPHVAWYARAARARLLQTAADNVAAFLAGRPQNVVNPAWMDHAAG